MKNRYIVAGIVLVWGCTMLWRIVPWEKLGEVDPGTKVMTGAAVTSFNNITLTNGKINWTPDMEVPAWAYFRIDEETFKHLRLDVEVGSEETIATIPDRSYESVPDFMVAQLVGEAPIVVGDGTNLEFDPDTEVFLTSSKVLPKSSGIYDYFDIYPIVSADDSRLIGYYCKGVV